MCGKAAGRLRCMLVKKALELRWRPPPPVCAALQDSAARMHCLQLRNEGVAFARGGRRTTTPTRRHPCTTDQCTGRESQICQRISISRDQITVCVDRETNLFREVSFRKKLNLNIDISKFVLLAYVTFSIGWFFMGQMDYELQPDRECCRLDESICALCRWKKNGKKRLLWIFFSSFFHFSCIPRAQVRQVTAYSAWLCRW